MKKLRNGYNFSAEPPIEFKNNEWPDEIKILMSKLDHQEKKGSSEPTEEIEALKDKIYKSKLEHLKSNIKDDFHLFETYSSQLIREYTSYSGEIKIEKLKPVTVLVRDFGQGQSVKSSCWCLASDVDSAVTCDKDLQTKLAVLPSWNDGGNRAVFIVPNEPPSIYVAVGKIAQQKNESDYETTVYHEGGGTQYNILTPNIPGEITENSGGFANAGKAFDKCCIVIVNNGIITSKDRTLITPDVTLQTSYSVANTEIQRK